MLAHYFYNTMYLYQGDNYFCSKVSVIQDLQSFHGHEQSSRLAPTLTMLVFLTFALFCEKVLGSPLYFFVFKLYKSTQ